jgi:uncharacterized caspase-like protein
MSRLLSTVTLLFASFALVALSVAPASAERRVALVIGNSQYKNTNLSLTNPKNDAEDVAKVLRGLDFEVIQATDAGKRELEMSLQKFARAATDADSALFFYAGHAMQYQGRNYLMPIDAELEDEISVRYQMVAIDDVRTALDRANGVKIMILDACRNNPIANRLTGASRSIATRGLARIDKTQGMVVAYATAADDVAMDGSGRNSPFTTALLKRLQEPGLEIEMMFRRIAMDVNSHTGGKQRPETYISLLSEYYLNQSDRLAWDRLPKDSAEALREFLSRFPASPRALDARYRLEMLERFARERELEKRKEQEEIALRQRQERENDQRRQEFARREAEERECQRDREILAGFGAGDAPGLQWLAQRTKCDDVRTGARQRIASIEADQKQKQREDEEREKVAALQRECTRDRETLAGLSHDDASGLQALAQRAKCDDVRSNVKQRLANLEAERARKDEESRKLAELARECQRERESIAGAGQKDVSRLQGLVARSRCDDVKASAAEKIAALEAERQQQAAREQERQRLAEFERVCKRERDSLASAGSKDLKTLQDLGQRAQCEDVRVAAAQRFERLQAEAQQLAAREQERQKQAELDRECQRDRESLARFGFKDVKSLNDLAQRSQCDDVRTSAAQRVASIETERVAQETACQRENIDFAMLQAAGSSARERVTEFMKSMRCEQLRPVVVASLGEMTAIIPQQQPQQPVVPQQSSVPQNVIVEPQLAKPSLVNQAKQLLAKLGCYAGPVNDKQDDGLSKALRKYRDARELETEVKLNDDFIAELKDIDEKVCVEQRAKPKKVIVKQTPSREEREESRPRRREPAPREQTVRRPPREAAPPPARVAAPAPSAAPREASRPSPKLMGIGF